MFYVTIPHVSSTRSCVASSDFGLFLVALLSMVTSLYTGTKLPDPKFTAEATNKFDSGT